MALLTVQLGFSVDMTNHGTSSMYDGYQSFDDHLIEFTRDDYNFVDAGGNFYYDFEGFLIGGTATSLKEYVDGYLAYTATGLNVEVFTGLDFVDSFDPVGTMTYAFRGDDVINGNSLNDVLSGFAGNDIVVGYGGDDVVAGGYGKDTLYGGQGSDAFFLLVGLQGASNVDKIKDYNDAFDNIWLDLNFYDLPGGKLANKYFHVGTHAHDKSDRIIYDKHHGEIFYDNNGSGRGGEVLVAKIGKDIGGLHGDDFLVI